MSSSPKLTINERAEIRKEIVEVFDQKRNLLIGADPTFENRIAERTRKVVVGKLKIDKSLTEIEKIDHQIAALERKKELLVEKVESTLPRSDSSSRRRSQHEYDVCERRQSICEAINRLMEKALADVRAKDTTGQKLLKLDQLEHELILKLHQCSDREQVAEMKIIELAISATK